METPRSAVVYHCGHGSFEQLKDANHHVFDECLCPRRTHITHPYHAPRLFIFRAGDWYAYKRSCHEILRMRACNTVFRAMFRRVWLGILLNQGERAAFMNRSIMDASDDDAYDYPVRDTALPHHRTP